jgi:DNA-binding CsgD family transcriptional regulator
MNAAASSLVSKAEGLVVDSAGLRAARSDDTARLRALIGGASETSAHRALHSGGVMRVSRPDGKPPLEILVSPLHLADDWQFIERAVAAVFVTDPSLAPPTADVLIRLYALTPSEAKVFATIASGASAKQAADELGVSYNTLKTHLRHIFTKTDTRSQGELVRLAQGGIAGLDLTAHK